MSNLFSRILVGIDDSEPSKIAIKLAARLAREHDGHLILCHSVDWMGLIAQVESTGTVIDPTPIIDGLKQQGEALLQQAATVAKHFGVDPQLRACEGPPATSILKLSGELKCGLIVMGTHGRHDLGRFFLGSTTEDVLRGSTIPVLTARPGMRFAPETRRCFERIVVGIDNSEPSDAALETAYELPAADRREFLLYSIVDIEAVILGSAHRHAMMLDDLRAQAKSVVDEALASARAHGVSAEGRVIDGSPKTELIATAQRQKADLIILGSHGRRGIRRFLLGSVAESVVRAAPVPVLVVRHAVDVPAPPASQEMREQSRV